MLTGLIVAGPLVALAVEVVVLWGRAVHVRDVLLTGALFLVTGHGVTVGFHRMLTHGSFKANRALRTVLTPAGSMAVEGSVVSRVANHRRHHMFSDRPCDPHSPYVDGTAELGLARGFVHAHLGWLFKSDDTAARRFAPDLLRDRDLVVISRPSRCSPWRPWPFTSASAGCCRGGRSWAASPRWCGAVMWRNLRTV